MAQAVKGIQNRLVKLLSDADQEEIYAESEFKDVEQTLYFDFTSDDLKTANQFRTIKAKVIFLFMCA